MSEQKKPREWWVIEYSATSRECFERNELDDVESGTTHVIEATPETLFAGEMLEALSEAWGYVFYYVNDPNTQDKDAVNVLQKMDRVIRKAKGGG